MFFIKKKIDSDFYEITFFNLPIEINIKNKKLFSIYFLDGSFDNRISIYFEYKRNPELFEKYLVLLLKDLYYNYIKEGIIFHEFEEQIKKLINNHFGG